MVIFPLLQMKTYNLSPRADTLIPLSTLILTKQASRILHITGMITILTTQKRIMRLFPPPQTWSLSEKIPEPLSRTTPQATLVVSFCIVSCHFFTCLSLLFFVCYFIFILSTNAATMQTTPSTPSFVSSRHRS